MAYNITAVETFDHKRNKVTLDFGEVTFLLYKGECRQRLKGTELSEEDYRGILEEILVPRAKKRVLYYMKNADKTRHQIREKLRQGLYPEEVIGQVMDFLDKYGFADDRNYAENYLGELRGRYSRREIEARLCKRGLPREEIRLQLESLTQEDEEEACGRALGARYPRGAAPEERQKAWQYLCRKGYGAEVINKVLGSTKEGFHGREDTHPVPEYCDEF